MSARASMSRSRPDHRRRGHEPQAQALALGQRRELGRPAGAAGEPSGTFVDHGRHDAGVELRDVEQGGEQPVDRLERQVDVLDQALGALRQLGLRQGGQEQAGGVERLQQIVRGGGEEAGLGDVGGVGPRPAPPRVARLLRWSSPRACSSCVVRLRTSASSRVARSNSANSEPCRSMLRSTRRTRTSRILRSLAFSSSSAASRPSAVALKAAPPDRWRCR